MTDNQKAAMREAFPGVEVEQHQGDYIRRIVLPNSRLVSDATASTDAEWRALVEKLVEALQRASKCQFQRYYTREDGSSYLAGDDDAEYFVREALAEAKLRGVV